MLLLLSLLLLFAGVTVIAVAAVTCLPPVAGIPLVPDILTVAGLPAIAGVPGVLGFRVVAFTPAIAGVPVDPDQNIDDGTSKTNNTKYTNLIAISSGIGCYN